MIPQLDGDSWLFVVHEHLLVGCSWRNSSCPVPESVFSARGGRSSVEAWYTPVLRIDESLSKLLTGILDRVLWSLGLPACFRHASFEYNAHITLRFELAAGLGESWTRDGGIPQGCPLSNMFIIALYHACCRYLETQEGAMRQYYADNRKYVSNDPEVLSHATRLTAGYVRLLGSELAPSKCVLMSTS